MTWQVLSENISWILFVGVIAIPTSCRSHSLEEHKQICALFTATNKIEREQGSFSSVVRLAGKVTLLSALQGTFEVIAIGRGRTQCF